MLPNQMPEPPLDMVMPATYSTMLTSNLVVLALILVWVIREVRRTNSYIPLFIMGGATVCSLLECIWDILGAVWYPQYGHTPMYRLFNISVPTWMLAAYPCYLGGLGNYVYKRLNEGMTMTQLWKFYVMAWLANFLLEIPVLNMHVYIYHGPQPFVLFGFPLWQAMGNAMMPIVIGSMAYVWKDMFSGARGLMLLLCVPIAQFTALGGVGWPTWLAMNSGIGYAATYPANVLSLCISLMMTYLIGSKVCRPAEARASERLVPKMS